MTKKSFIKGAAILAIAGLICKILGAAYRIPLGNIIGTEGMGNYQMAYPVFSLLVVISASGIPTAISKLVSEREAAGDRSGANYVFRVSLIALSVLGVSSCLLLASLSQPISRALGMASSSISLVAISPALLVISITAAFRGYFQGLQLMSPTAASQVSEQVVKLAAGIYFAKALMPLGPAYGAAGALLGVSLSEAGGLLVVLGYYMRCRKKPVLYAPKKIAKKGDYKKTLGLILRIAIPVTMGACVMPFVAAIDSFMVMRVLQGMGYSSQEASSLYGLLTGFVQPLINMPSVISVALSVSLVPAISFARAQRRYDTVSRETSLGFRLAILLGLPLAVLFFLFARPVLHLLYGSLSPDDLTRATHLMQIMSIAILFLSVVQIQTGILQGMGRTLLPVGNMILGAAVKVFVGIWLIRVPSLNVTGAAMGTVMCLGIAAILDSAMVVRYSRIRFHVGDYIIRPLVCTAGMGAGAWVVWRFSYPHVGGGAGLLLAVAAAVLIYAILLVLLQAIRKEDLAHIPGGEKGTRILVRLGIWK